MGSEFTHNPPDAGMQAANLNPEQAANMEEKDKSNLEKLTLYRENLHAVIATLEDDLNKKQANENVLKIQIASAEGSAAAVPGSHGLEATWKELLKEASDNIDSLAIHLKEVKDEYEIVLNKIMLESKTNGDSVN